MSTAMSEGEHGQRARDAVGHAVVAVRADHVAVPADHFHPVGADWRPPPGQHPAFTVDGVDGVDGVDEVDEVGECDEAGQHVGQPG